jgi:uncharacterized protein
MTRRVHDPRRLDVEALAADGATLEGAWPLAELGRLCADHPADAPAPSGDVRWQARGERRGVGGGPPGIWLHLRATARVVRSCQRCLRPMEVEAAVDRWFRFVDDEAQAATLDADSEEDVLALDRALDLRELIEDEVMLELPMVPRHERCPTPAAAPRAAAQGDDAAPHPFAALAGWRGKPPRR